VRNKLVAGNWKMHGSRASVKELVRGLIDAGPFDCQVAVFPPHVFLEQVKQLIADSPIGLGAQNVDWHAHGAFTGETSAPMLKDVGCEYCIVGHSERRSLFGETDDVVADKFAACIEWELTPVLCVGETLAERRADRTAEVVSRQLRAVIDRVGVGSLAHAVIAYEPVWAIGTGESALPEQAEAVHVALREMVAREDANISRNIQILYGGSVNGENAASLLTRENIDGALVGGASLKAEEFASICKVTAT